MLLSRGEARDQGLGPRQPLLHCPHQPGWAACSRPAMAIIILGLSSKELGQLHLHSHRGIVKLVSVSKMKYDITFLCCPLHARLVNMNYTKYYSHFIIIWILVGVSTVVC